MPATNTHIALLCPFDLGRQTGTPIRAAMVVAQIRKCTRASAVTLGGGDPAMTRVIPGVWKRSRDGKRLSFRLGRYTAACLRALAAIRADAVHVFSSVPFPAALLYRSARPEVTVVTEFHGLFKHEMSDARREARFVYTGLDRLAAKMSDGTIAVSRRLRKRLIVDYGARPNRCRVILGPVDLHQYPYRPKPVGRPLVAGYSGNASRWQGLEVVFEACRLLRGSNDVRFVFSGFDPVSAPVPKQPNVEVLGSVPPRTLPKVVAGYDVFLSTRLPEPAAQYQYPSKISMALATGRPLLATRVGDQEEIVRRVRCGMLVDPGSAQALVDGLRAFATLSRKEWLDMGRRGRAFAEKELDLSRLAPTLMKFYSEVRRV